MSCRTQLFLPYLLLPPSPNFCKWKLHWEGILFDYPLSFTLHILSISKLCQLLLGNISTQLDLRAAPLPDTKAPLPLTWTSCKILHAFALVSLWFVPTEQPAWAFYISQTMHCSLQISKWFPISLSQIQYLYHSPQQCLKALPDLATPSSLILSITPHQLLHPSFPASATLLFLFFHHTFIHKNINSMRVFYKLLHPLNQEQCLAQSHIHWKNRLNY